MEQNVTNKTECFAYNKKVVMEELKKQGVKQIYAEFDGSGDSGCLQCSLHSLPNKNTRVQTFEDKPILLENKWVNKYKKETVEIEQAIEDLMYEALEVKFAAWEINEGAYGKITLNPQKETIEIEMWMRSVEYQQIVM
jgi:hypothetical protein